MTQAILVAYAQPVSDEREPEFNHWYDEVHIPQVVERIPGIVGGSRYKFADIQLVPTAPAPDRSYLAVYQLDTDDLAATVERLGAALSDGTLDKTDTVSMTVAAPVLHFYSALNDRVAR
ncbi:hypothetical protein [Rhodococcus opacus]|uniref:EthD domain-containing protein n=1 Tax=Rhodococcus opacus TaxID=37919 RepID=A0A076F513_RHOOP|nr:hypothetical protein [Rhodococcus opacus]AII10804.1 hypothetical protein EP51_42260 [Rhodococcus opacus]